MSYPIEWELGVPGCPDEMRPVDWLRQEKCAHLLDDDLRAHVAADSVLRWEADAELKKRAEHEAFLKGEI